MKQLVKINQTKKRKRNENLFEEGDLFQVLETFLTNDLSPQELQKNDIVIVKKVLSNEKLTLTNINHTQNYYVVSNNFPKLKPYLK